MLWGVNPHGPLRYWWFRTGLIHLPGSEPVRTCEILVAPRTGLIHLPGSEPARTPEILVVPRTGLIHLPFLAWSEHPLPGDALLGFGHSERTRDVSRGRCVGPGRQ